MTRARVIAALTGLGEDQQLREGPEPHDLLQRPPARAAGNGPCWCETVTGLVVAHRKASLASGWQMFGTRNRS